MKYLNGKTVIVTGASSGIGLKISERLIKKYDCTVLAVARNVNKLEDAKNRIDVRRYIPFSCDVSKLEEWVRLKNYILESDLKPNILINCAGIMLPFLKTENITIDDFNKVLSTDFYSVLYSTQTVVPVLSGDKGLVNISSSSALCPIAGQSPYVAAKSAVKSLTEVLQTEENYYVGLMLPGFCQTDIMRSIDVSEKEKKLIDKVSITSEKCAKKICNAVNKKRRRKIIGLDAKLMNFLYKISPKSAGRIIAWVLRKSKLKIFDGIAKN